MKKMMNNSFFSILPFLLAADLMIPFLLAPTYKGYSHLMQVMSVLGSSKAPLHSIYNIWLIIFGCTILVSLFQCYSIIAKTSNIISIILCSVIFIYAIGGCILSGFFSVGETKNLETVSAKIHGYGSVIGFLLLTLAPLLIGLYFFKISDGFLGVLSLICFILAIAFFVLFVMADKPNYKGTIIAFEGLWQRLSLLFMYCPIAILSLNITLRF
ncbi:DUF998 domain-containing protein [Intestinimonas butyriciproducens]|uniref:DUF998 domain-containing protein n=2 Tax=Intestinimonas butyriciproducens TaxID=1297617 RepID=UPI00232C81BD|nr:DUF998 domain-containing protein [Intestinimonas butyriciproducens]MDB7815589.1 DUF998 domain-containing protein [Intestinimonas butyriciproducens]MDB7844654.1 DUF998 domain-containing protein [Intestinimonas butyriciproducens]MDB7856611.1 DUF998 domain-containing protein [Intestinimonas butyriciproducens]